MLQFLNNIDTAIFVFCNRTISNPVFDVVMPALTDWNKTIFGWMVFLGLWLVLMWKGGPRGRMIGVLLVPIIIGGDLLNSHVLKAIIQRPRPCHTVGGVQIVANVRLLVPCGSGYSFPSSHAFNSFALATFVSHYYRKLSRYLFVYAGIMAFSRVAVGVHFPSDVLAGALFGLAYSLFLIALLDGLSRHTTLLDCLRSTQERASPLDA